MQIPYKGFQNRGKIPYKGGVIKTFSKSKKYLTRGGSVFPPPYGGGSPPNFFTPPPIILSHPIFCFLLPIFVFLIFYPPNDFFSRLWRAFQNSVKRTHFFFRKNSVKKTHFFPACRGLLQQCTKDPFFSRLRRAFYNSVKNLFLRNNCVKNTLFSVYFFRLRRDFYNSVMC